MFFAHGQVCRCCVVASGFFGCIIFVSLLWINFNKWPYASIDTEAGPSPFQKKKCGHGFFKLQPCSHTL
jgi:hypothetical protein